ncbi:hypothetical protein GIB67_041195 [Kingdonia uniflora]|uniref:Mur ligase central domain-containing protein n=1 Tax=Kingdonia uniflora TaxID=39325 RepID=A0A7J7MIX8_9MAGN|nr:hypothetical protein GIB67_041195 [Kingdonia uniflora]
MGRMKRLMERLGNPQCNYKAVHIAGTKGKGSTAAFVANILREEGPHLWSIRERISLGKNGDLVLTAVAFTLFARESIDIAVVEVVLGGPFKPHMSVFFGIKIFIGFTNCIGIDSGSRSTIKNVEINNGKPCQVCDILIQVEKDLQLDAL